MHDAVRVEHLELNLDVLEQQRVAERDQLTRPSWPPGCPPDRAVASTLPFAMLVAHRSACEGGPPGEKCGHSAAAARRCSGLRGNIDHAGRAILGDMRQAGTCLTCGLMGRFHVSDGKEDLSADGHHFVGWAGSSPGNHAASACARPPRETPGAARRREAPARRGSRMSNSKETEPRQGRSMPSHVRRSLSQFSQKCRFVIAPMKPIFCVGARHLDSMLAGPFVRKFGRWQHSAPKCSARCSRRAVRYRVEIIASLSTSVVLTGISSMKRRIRSLRPRIFNQRNQLDPRCGPRISTQLSLISSALEAGRPGGGDACERLRQDNHAPVTRAKFFAVQGIERNVDCPHAASARRHSAMRASALVRETWFLASSEPFVETAKISECPVIALRFDRKNSQHPASRQRLAACHAQFAVTPRDVAPRARCA